MRLRLRTVPLLPVYRFILPCSFDISPRTCKFVRERKNGRVAPITPNWRIIGSYLYRMKSETSTTENVEEKKRKFHGRSESCKQEQLLKPFQHNFIAYSFCRYVVLFRSSYVSATFPRGEVNLRRRERKYCPLRRRGGKEAVSGAQRAHKINHPVISPAGYRKRSALKSKLV